MFTSRSCTRRSSKHKTTLQIYAERLIDGLIPEGEIDEMKAEFRKRTGTRVRGRQGIQAQQGRLAGRALVGHLEGREGEDDPRAARPPSSR
jgi:2-oxoglutarate dehydrogenase complex dehydrogenase (E1) component-like enzyme